VIVFDFFSGDFFYAIQYGGFASTVVVGTYDIITIFNQICNRMRSDVATTSGNQYFFQDNAIIGCKEKEKSVSK
jgi:hypothetical protein